MTESIYPKFGLEALNMTKKFSVRLTLTIEHDRNSRHRQTLTLPPKNMLVTLQEKNIRHGG